MKIKFAVIILILLLISSFIICICNPIFFRKAFYEITGRNGIISYRNSQGQLDGKYFAYLNGHIYIEGNFLNGLRHGWSVYHFNNGQVKDSIFYKNGKAEGLEKLFYENGKLNYRVKWHNDNRYGSGYHFSPNGQLAIYNAFDIKNLFYYSEFNNSHVKKIIGNIISPNIYSKSIKDSIVFLENGHSYVELKDLYFSVATPPKLQTELVIKINEIQQQNFKITDNEIHLKDALKDCQSCRIFIAGKLVDDKKRVIRKDTLDLNITNKM